MTAPAILTIFWAACIAGAGFLVVRAPSGRRIEAVAILVAIVTAACLVAWIVALQG